MNTSNALDTLRTRLRDVIFGRPRIQVLADPITDIDNTVPIFVIGTFRSGTTFLRYLLDSHSHIGCPPETKFMVHLAGLYQKQSTMEAFDSMGFNSEYVRKKIKSFANNFYKLYLEANQKKVIIDKTPDYVRILNFLDWLYEGKVKYILIFRNGLDVAQSMNSTPIEPLEPDKTLNSAFNYWKHDTELMLDWLNRYPERCCKIVYEKLCSDVNKEISRVLEFIGEQWEDEILKWYEKRHDRGQEDIKARRQRKINKSSHNFEHWDKNVIEQFKEESRIIHTAIGYNADTLELS